VEIIGGTAYLQAITNTKHNYHDRRPTMNTLNAQGRTDPSGGTSKITTILNLVAVSGFVVYMFLI
jgi:hypothetical protein